MTSTIAVTNGVGAQTGKLFAFDAVSTVTLTGLATAYNGLALTGYVTSLDGKTALAPLATCTAGTTTATLVFDFRTRPCRSLFAQGNQTEQSVRLRILVTATGQVVADATCAMVPGPESGLTTTATANAAATLAEAQALVDAHNVSATAHAALFAATVIRATADGQPLADANRFEVGQYIGTAWVYCAKTGTQVLAWIRASLGNASTAAAGLSPQATAPAAGLRSVLAIDNGETARTDKALYDATAPAMDGIAAAGTAMAAARRDHTHASDTSREPTQTAASQVEMEAGTEAALRSVSPLRVAQAVAAQAVVKTTLHANSLLYAIADHTPTELLLAASKIVGRSSTGDIVAKDCSDLAFSLLARATATLMRGDLGAAPLAAVKHLWFPAGAAIPRATNGAASGTVEAATNDVMYDTFDFDSATAEGIAWVVTLPDWNLGTIKFKPIWTAATGSGTFILSVAGRAYADDDAIDQAAGTAQTSTDTLITAGDIHIGPASAAITIAGTLSANLPIILQGVRDIADTLNADARLIGILVEYTKAATEEAAW